MSYFDIDSSYRDRSQWPLPAQFVIKQDIRPGEGLEATNPVSNNLVLFPPQNPNGQEGLQLEPLAFYEEDGVVRERAYLPYMFSVTGSDKTLFLDELPIAPTTTTLENPIPSDFTRNTVVLDQNQNAYIGKYLENVATGEIRQIVGLRYENEPRTVQTGILISYYIESDRVFVVLRANPTNDIPPSNVDRFYQGKRILFDNLEERLIINSFINSQQEPVLELDSKLGEIPAMGTSISLIAPERWFVTLDEPFSTSIPAYPAYQTPVPEPAVLYTRVPITTDDEIVALKAVRHANGTIGLAYQTSRKLVYVSSTDTEGTSWNTPVVIRNLDDVDASEQYTFESGRIHELDVKIVFDDPGVGTQHPTILFTEGYAHEPHLMYVRAQDETGTSWNTVQDVLESISASTTHIHPTQGVVRLHIAEPIRSPLTSASNLYPGKPDWPEVIYTNVNGYIGLRPSSGSGTTGGDPPGPPFPIGNSTDINAPIWNQEDGHLQADVSQKSSLMDIGMFLNASTSALSVADYNTIAIGDNVNKLVLLVSQDGTNYPSYFRRNLTANNYAGPGFINAVIAQDSFAYGSLNVIEVNLPTGTFGSFTRTVARTVDIPMAVMHTKNGEIVTRTMALQLDGIFGRVTGQPDIVAETNVSIPQEQLASTYNALSASSDYGDGDTQSSIAYINNQQQLTTFKQTAFQLDQSIPVIISSEDKVGRFTMLPNTTLEEPIFIIQNLDKSVYGLIPVENVLTTGVQYRIRDGVQSSLLGVGGTSTGIVSGTERTVVLPATIPTNPKVGDFIWIYNQNITTVPANFQMFSDYRQIVSYDASSRTVTVDQPFSANIQDAVFTDGNTVNWEIFPFSTDGVQTFHLPYQPPRCYQVRLLHLTLPNILLSVANGNRIAFYPYVYVELYSGSRQTFYSNNPNATKATFKVPITNLVDPDNSDFVNISGINMIQNIYLSLQEPIQFTVRMPNGEIFQTLRKDTLSPFPPDPSLQVSAMFQLS